MKAIVLSAGFATRLYPLTKDKAKSLLKIKNKLMIDFVYEKLKELELEEIFLVTNDNFFNDFLDWAKDKDIKILNDKIDSEENRLGSIGDLSFVIKNEDLNDDLLIVAGDNLFEDNLKGMLKVFNENKGVVVGLYDIKDLEESKRFGVVKIKDNKIIDFKEKPKEPETSLISTCVYFFPRRAINLIRKYLNEGNSADKTGEFIEWLYKKEDVYAYILNGKWFDIGDINSLNEAKEWFR